MSDQADRRIAEILRRLTLRVVSIVVGDVDMEEAMRELAEKAEQEAEREIEDLIRESGRERANSAWIAALRLRGL